MKYKVTWQDHVRHISNLAFVGSYLFFERGLVVPGACCTIVGEMLLAPSAWKQRAWSTLALCSLFFVLAIGTIARSLFA